MIFLTGDKHIPQDIYPLSDKKFSQGKTLSKNDYIIVTGDFGGVWDGSKTDKYWLDWFEEEPYTLLFVDGNHENFDRLKLFPTEMWNGGKVHQIRSNVIHLMRGQIFTLENETFFTFGGANSYDKIRRTAHIDWWEDEMPCYQEYEEGLRNLEQQANQVDYIISHECSTRTLLSFARMFPSFSIELNNLNTYFETLEDFVSFKHWFFGHYHHNINVDNRHTMLFTDVIPLK